MNSKSRGSEYIMETILSSVQDDDDVGELSESLDLNGCRDRSLTRTGLTLVSF